MATRIGEWLADRGLPYPAPDEAIVRLIVESLAEHFAAAVRTAAQLSGVAVEQIHVVGGGCQNRLLCQLAADRSGLPVVAGPVEAVALNAAPINPDWILEGTPAAFHAMAFDGCASTTGESRLRFTPPSRVFRDDLPGHQDRRRAPRSAPAPFSLGPLRADAQRRTGHALDDPRR